MNLCLFSTHDHPPPSQAKIHVGHLPFPPKEKFKASRSSFSSRGFVERRREALDAYLSNLVTFRFKPFQQILFDFLGVSQILRV